MKYMCSEIRKESSAEAAKNAGRQPNTEDGFVFVFFSFCMFLLFGLTALVIDIGSARLHQRRIQMGADAAALAAALELGDTGNVSKMLDAAHNYADANNVEPESEFEALEMGCWNGTSLNSATPIEIGNQVPVCSPGTYAVHVQSSHWMPTYFGKVIGVQSLEPRVDAVALAPASTNNCVRPFGIEQSLLGSAASPAVPVGTEFVVEEGSPGNWGKLDIIRTTSDGKYQNMSSGKNFEDAMLNNVCSSHAAIGEWVRTGTGFGGPIKSIFDEMSAVQKQGMIIPVTTDFSNGRSADVMLLEFVKVDFISQGASGKNWWGKFRLVARNVTPPTEYAVSGNARLVK